MKQVSNESGLSLDFILCSQIGEVDPQKTINMLGGDSSNPSWDEYLADYKDEFQPHVILMKKCIEENNLVGETGGKMANDWCFKFSDGYVFTLSWRAWGDFMQAVVNKKEGYMAYYM